jgi:hypothetical protein
MNKAPVAAGRATRPMKLAAAPPGGPAPEPSFPVAGESLVLMCACLRRRAGDGVYIQSRQCQSSHPCISSFADRLLQPLFLCPLLFCRARTHACVRASLLCACCWVCVCVLFAWLTAKPHIFLCDHFVFLRLLLAAPEAPARTSSGPSTVGREYGFPSTTTPYDDYKFAPIRESQVRDCRPVHNQGHTLHTHTSP